MKAQQKMKIKLIQAEIDAARAEYNVKVLPLKQRLETEFNAVFDADAELQATIKALESSTEYGIDEYGEAYTWVRLDRTLIERYKGIDGAMDQLERYLSDSGYHLNLKEDCILNFQGAYIGINDDGDVYLQDGKTDWIIDRKDYKTIGARNALIEAHMEHTGHYPVVLKIGRYGDVTVVNTQQQAAKV